MGPAQDRRCRARLGSVNLRDALSGRCARFRTTTRLMQCRIRPNDILEAIRFRSLDRKLFT